MGCGTDLLRKLHKKDRASYSLEITCILQFLRHGKKIQSCMLVYKNTHSFEYHPVLFTIEAVRSKFSHRFIHTVRFNQKSTEDCLFDIKSLRWSVTHLKPKCI